MLSSGSPGRWPRTCASRGNAQPRHASSPPPGSAEGLETSVRRSPAQPAHRNPANPAPDDHPAPSTAGPHPATTWAKPPAENAPSRPGANTQVKRQAEGAGPNRDLPFTDRVIAALVV